MVSCVYLLLASPVNAQAESEDAVEPNRPCSVSARPASLVESIEMERWPEAEAILALATAEEIQLRQPDGMTALHWAVFHEQVELVERLLRRGADANARTDYGITPLAIACELGAPRLVKKLLESGAEVNATIAGKTTPLMLAARTGVPGSVKALLRRGAEVEATEAEQQTALMWAAAAGNTTVVELLVAAGADLGRTLDSGFTPLAFAARDGKFETAMKLIDLGADVNAVLRPKNSAGRAPRPGMSPLLLAVESGHFELALALVERGAEPNDLRSGFAPLHALTWVRKASRGDNVEGDPPPRGSGQVTSLQFVRELVKAGADVNLQLERGGGGRAKLSMRGVTPFLLASKTADLPLLKLLLELGADPHIANADGCTPLMAVAGVGVTAVDEEPGTELEVIETIDLLMELGADPNVVDANGETAMHGAAYRTFPKVVAKLAELGADPLIWNHKNKYGWTPQLIAAGHRPGSFKPSPETIAALERAMAE